MAVPLAVPHAQSGALLAATLATATVIGAGQTNLQETNALVWVLLGISVAGAIVTFSFLVYSMLRFRDPKAKRRRYG